MCEVWIILVYIKSIQSHVKFIGISEKHAACFILFTVYSWHLIYNRFEVFCIVSECSHQTNPVQSYFPWRTIYLVKAGVV